MQVEWKWCDGLCKDNFKHKLYIALNLWKEAPLPSLYYTLCFSMGITSKCHFSPRLPSGSPKIETLVVPKLWTFIYIYIYIFQIKSFKKMRAQYIIAFKKYFQHCITRTNWTSFDPCFQGICGQESNSQFDFYFFFYNHNSCKSDLNEQCEITLNITLQDLFNDVLGAQIDACLFFPTKVSNIHNSCMNATPKVGMHLGVTRFHPLHSPPFVRMCFTPKHIIGLIGLCILHLVVNLMLGLQHIY